MAIFIAWIVLTGLTYPALGVYTSTNNPPWSQWQLFAASSMISTFGILLADNDLTFGLLKLLGVGP